MDHESARSRGHPVLVCFRAARDKQPSKGADAYGERDSRSNGKSGLRTACAIRAGSRMMGQRESVLAAWEQRNSGPKEKAALGRLSPRSVRCLD
jgi:hypothetical protein